MNYLEQRRAYIEAGRPLKTKEKKPIAKISPKRAAKMAEEKKLGTDKPADEYFEYWMKNAEPVCAECGMRADWLLEEQIDPKKKAAYETMWRACQAHILPKKKKHGFPLLAGNLTNHITLFPSWGGHLCGCHGFYDSNWYNATTMKIWPQIVEIFKTKLYPLIPEAERKNIPEQLLKEIQ